MACSLEYDALLLGDKFQGYSSNFGFLIGLKSSLGNWQVLHGVRTPSIINDEDDDEKKGNDKGGGGNEKKGGLKSLREMFDDKAREKGILFVDWAVQHLKNLELACMGGVSVLGAYCICEKKADIISILPSLDKILKYVKEDPLILFVEDNNLPKMEFFSYLSGRTGEAALKKVNSAKSVSAEKIQSRQILLTTQIAVAVPLADMDQEIRECMEISMVPKSTGLASRFVPADDMPLHEVAKANTVSSIDENSEVLPNMCRVQFLKRSKAGQSLFPKKEEALKIGSVKAFINGVSLHTCDERWSMASESLRKDVLKSCRQRIKMALEEQEDEKKKEKNSQQDLPFRIFAGPFTDSSLMYSDNSMSDENLDDVVSRIEEICGKMYQLPPNAEEREEMMKKYPNTYAQKKNSMRVGRPLRWEVFLWSLGLCALALLGLMGWAAFDRKWQQHEAKKGRQLNGKYKGHNKVEEL